MLALLFAILLSGVSKVNTPAAPPTLKTPLVLTIRQSVGMSPLTLRVKVRAAEEGAEVCVVVDGPEYQKTCRQLWGVTWTMDFTLRTGGNYAVFAASGPYRTPESPVKVIGLNDPEGQ